MTTLPQQIGHILAVSFHGVQLGGYYVYILQGSEAPICSKKQQWQRSNYAIGDGDLVVSADIRTRKREAGPPMNNVYTYVRETRVSDSLSLT